MQNYELMISVENSYQGLALKKVNLHVTSIIPSFVSSIEECALTIQDIYLIECSIQYLPSSSILRYFSRGNPVIYNDENDYSLGLRCIFVSFYHFSILSLVRCSFLF